MDDKLVQEIRRKMDSLSTKKLNKIFEEHNRSVYSEEAFEAIRQILLERGERYIPPAPITEDYSADEFAKLDKIRKKKFYGSGIIGFIAIIILGIAIYFIFIAPKNTDTVSKPIISNQASKQNDLQVIDWTMTYDEYSRCIVGTVKNNSQKTYSYAQVEFSLYDDSGAQVGSTFAVVDKLEPNGTGPFKALVDEAGAASAQLKGVSGH